MGRNHWRVDFREGGCQRFRSASDMPQQKQGNLDPDRPKSRSSVAGSQELGAQAEAHGRQARLAIFPACHQYVTCHQMAVQSGDRITPVFSPMSPVSPVKRARMWTAEAAITGKL